MRCFHPVSTDCPFRFAMTCQVLCHFLSLLSEHNVLCLSNRLVFPDLKCKMQGWNDDGVVSRSRPEKSQIITHPLMFHITSQMFQPIQTEMTRCALKRTILHAMISVVSVWVFSLFVPSDWHCWICGDTTWFGQDVARKATRSAQSWRLKPLRSEAQAEESKSCFPKNTIKVENGPNPTNVRM